MRLLVFAEDAPGAIVRSLLPGLMRVAEVTRVNTANPAWLTGRRSLAVIALRQREARQADARLIEAVTQFSPDAVLLVKGRGLSGDAVRRVRQAGVPVAIYYPDNPFWRKGDTGDPVERIREVSLAIVWSERIAEFLRPIAQRVEVLPFGYDDRWYRLGEPGAATRDGIVFVGTWSLRRERFLRALKGLPLVVRGSGWGRAALESGPPVTEADAGELLRRSLIGVNLLHPQNAGAHNMRTREIAASGALELTEPGTDGTPLRDAESCAWFRTPDELRSQVSWFLDRPHAVEPFARMAQELVAEDTYVSRGQAIGRLVEGLSAPPVSSSRPRSGDLA